MPKRNITVEELEEATAFMAWLVQRHGEKYMCIFDRLNRELEEKKAAREVVAAMAAKANLHGERRHIAQPNRAYAQASPQPHKAAC